MVLCRIGPALEARTGFSPQFSSTGRGWAKEWPVSHRAASPWALCVTRLLMWCRARLALDMLVQRIWVTGCKSVVGATECEPMSRGRRVCSVSLFLYPRLLCDGAV